MSKKKNKGFDTKKDNNNIDPYGYDFVPTIAHWTNIDEQRKDVNRLENISKMSNKSE